jgi:outer membrane receptor protein involved in Fe transport
MSARKQPRRLLGVLLLLAAATAVSPARAATREFDIDAGPATQTITRFAQQAGLPVLFPYDLLQGRRTPALRGRYEVHAGLRALLQDSGLIAYINSRGQVSIRPADPPRQAAVQASGNPFDSLQALNLEQELPEATVTGTRIARDGMTTATPVAVISSEEIAGLGPSTLVDALTQLPHFLNSDTPQTQSFGTSGAAGASHLNLRGIGSIRTLTLLDGRRIVPSTRLGTVDIALLPRNLIRRVEVVTGGASAAYGSDAVTGVVNMMLDTEFRGLRGHVQGGLTELGDYQNQELGLAWGTRVGEQSSLLLSGEYFHADGIRGYDTRSWFNSTAAIANPDPAGPGEIIAPEVHATGYTYGGLITAGPLAGTQFLPGGVPATFERGSLVTGTTQSGGSGVDPAANLIWLLPDQQRISTFARFTTQPSATASGFLQVLAARRY